MKDLVKNKIETTGQLREFLASMIVAVKDGTVSTDVASRITKLSAQITESFYSEIKVARIRAEAGEQLTSQGCLKIGEVKA